MKKDINIPQVDNVLVTISPIDEKWEVHIINRNAQPLETLLITSRGYGTQKGEPQKTSLLRHAFPSLAAGEFALVEPIDPSVFHLSNEYWVSYFQDGQMFDKKFIFVPGSINDQNMSYIPELKRNGIIHS